MTSINSGRRLPYAALGLLWPAIVAIVFFVVGWDDPSPSLALLVAAGLQVWVIQLVVTVPAFAILWLASRLLLPRFGAAAPDVGRLFFWTSLIGSPLALIFLLSI